MPNHRPSRLACAAPGVIVLLASLATGAPARAADTSSSTTLAQSLFDEGKRLMARGSYAEACPKLAESERLDPAGGTLLHLGVCHAREGKTASAWTELNQSVSAARRDGRGDREKAARAELATLEPKLSKLSLTVARGSGASNAGLEVRLDGLGVGAVEREVSLPVDPGAHDVSASAPGKKTWSTKITVGPSADRVAVVVPLLEDAPPVALAAVPPVEAPAPLAVARDVAPDPHPPRTQRTIALVAGGIGVAGIALGAVFGIVSKSKHDAASSACTFGPGGNECNAAGHALDADAVSAGNVSTVGFVAGGVGLAGAAVLWLTAPRAGASGVAVAPGPGVAGLAIRGAW